jgi:hypothetical protein
LIAIGTFEFSLKVSSVPSVSKVPFSQTTTLDGLVQLQKNEFFSENLGKTVEKWNEMVYNGILWNDFLKRFPKLCWHFVDMTVVLWTATGE